MRNGSIVSLCAYSLSPGSVIVGGLFAGPGSGSGVGSGSGGVIVIVNSEVTASLVPSFAVTVTV